MKLTDACGGVAILMFVAGLSAQTDPRPARNSETTGGTPIVTVGCINRAVQTGSLAPAPGVPPATPAETMNLANSSEPINAFLLAGATTANATGEMRARAAAGEPAKASPATPATYVLDGTRQVIEPHVGHQVEVTGSLRTVSEGTSANKTNVAHIRVASLKMLGSTCPKSKGPQ